MTDTSPERMADIERRVSKAGSDYHLLLEQKEDVLDLIAKVAELEKQVALMRGLVSVYHFPSDDKREQLWRDYVAFLFEANRGPVTIAHTHHWRCPDEDVKRGKQFRKDLGIGDLEGK